MLEYPSISKQNPEFPDYLDFQKLRDIGIQHLQELAGQLWTDHNLHDPGITILEVLCYAITDLGYRNNLDIKDLLALNPKDPYSQENNFFTSDRILTCNPVTELDLRKRLIDIPGVRNAWLKKVEPKKIAQEQETAYEPTIYVNCTKRQLQYELPEGKSEKNALKLNPRGLYRVCLDLESQRRRDACGKIYYSQATALEAVKKVLCSYRNLCEDFHDIYVLGEEEIALCTDIELDANADPEGVLVEIYVKVQEFLAPRVRFYTLKELLDKGKSMAEIFAGRPSAIPNRDRNSPYTSDRSHGFINTDELNAITLREKLYTSDLYQIIIDVPGVTAIRKLSIINYINGLRQSQGDSWCLHLTDKHRLKLGIEYSTVTFYQGDLPFKPDIDEVKRRYYEQQDAYIKAARDDRELDAGVPQGSYAKLADHYSIHYDFPLTYGIGEDGLPGNVPALRKAQARQLKGYLVFFDQLLANYLAQLAHIRDLFSWEADETDEHASSELLNGSKTRQGQKQRTYFTQPLKFPGVEEILGQESDYADFLNSISEDKTTYEKRRNRFLDHLLARFAESFSDYVRLNYRIKAGHASESEIVNDKARFLQDYPELSRDRFRAFNYCNCDRDAIWDTNNVSGFKKRVSRLLGIDDYKRRSLSHYEIVSDEGGYGFILRSEADDSPLLRSKRIYLNEEEAQNAGNNVLTLARNSEHYTQLSYRYFYRYSWEVTDRQGESLLAYEGYFLSQAERDAALNPLLEDLRSVPTESAETSTVETEAEFTPPPRYYILDTDAEGRFRFQLAIPVPGKASITFFGTQHYPNEVKAYDAIEESLARIQTSSAYRKRRLPQSNEDNETEADLPQGFIYYSYGIIDTEGNMLAEATRFWPTEADRDDAIESLQLQVQSAALRLEIQSQSSGYRGIINDKHNGDGLEKPILLQSSQNYDTEVSAWEQGNELLPLVQDRDNFRLIDSDRALYGWALTNKEKDRVLAEGYYTSEDARNRAIDKLQARINDEGFHVLEHILLRPSSKNKHDFLPISVNAEDCQTDTGKPPCLTSYDPYSFWVSVILPYWPQRFQNLDFRRFVEQTLRLEAPAHVALKICWLNVQQMHDFENAYQHWLKELNLEACQGVACDITGALNRLIAVLKQLKTIHPEGTLHDCEESGPDENPIVLNQTNLGNA